MARTHPRDSSPYGDQQADPPKVLKRLKSSDATQQLEGPTRHFANGVFDHNSIARLHTTYASNEPFKYAVVDKLFQENLLVKVKDECVSQLSFTEKETDIYKVNQTGDLASLNYLTPQQIALLPNILTLRDALYSQNFRSFVRAVTGCGPLSGIKQDMSVNSYTNGCHLLNHDDVIGTRRVSYILYMPLPHYQMWQKDWGGALELYPTVKNENDQLEPESIPSKSIPPSWNQFIFFEVQPGKSFHSVEEVVIGGDEDPRERLSISGWFHAAQEGEDGFVPEQPTTAQSSREQLQNTKTVFKQYPSSQDPETLVGANSLADDDREFLSEFLNPVYLKPRTMQTLATRFAEESQVELHSFLNHALAETLKHRLRELDEKDGLGINRPTIIPPHTAGITINPTISSPDSYFAARSSTFSNSSTSMARSPNQPQGSGSNTPNQPQSNWIVRGPPHKWRYCVLASKNNKPAEAVVPRAAQVSSDEILRSLQDELFPSPAFRAWLSIVASMMPLGWSAEARRFRPGLDYTLATSDEEDARLDVVLGLTPEIKVGLSQNGTSRPRGWQAAEWGGWECYMAPHNEDDDPAVYRSGSTKTRSAPPPKSSTSASTSTTTTEDTVMHIDPTSYRSPPREASDSPTNGNGIAADMNIDDASEAEEDDSTLLTVQPGFNRLLLVLRDQRVMRFVKYISASAEGSRWDVCGEYEIGMLLEEEEENGIAM